MTRTQICRILDANLNRGGEALREIEDAARFSLNSSSLSQRCKQIRHSLGEAPEKLNVSPFELAAARDSEADVGRPEQNRVVTGRASSADVVVAAFKRLEQALRTLEEYSKLLHSDSEPGFEAMRYAVYSIEKDFLARLKPNLKLESAKVYLLLIGDLLDQCDHETALHEAIEGGIDMVQIREKEMTDSDFLRLACKLQEICDEAGVISLINDRPHIARAANADGVHLGDDDVPLSAASEMLGSEKIIGATSHTLEEALRGQDSGADYLGFGTMFPTETKKGLKIRGIEEYSKLGEQVVIPVFAIGGIDLGNLDQLLEKDIRRVAVSSAILKAKDIASAASEFKQRLSVE